MGFRYRKSFKLGGGFRINLSKSGVGYSWGGKGFRITKTARGTTRTTVSIPGSGLSYTSENSSKRGYSSNSSPGHARSGSARQSLPQAENGGYYDTKDIKNTGVSDMIPAGLEDILSAARKSLIWNNIAAYGVLISLFLMFINPVFFVSLTFFLFFGAYVQKVGEIEMDYDMDEFQKDSIERRMNSILRLTNSKKIWMEQQTSKIADRKYSGGAETAIKRKVCKAKRKAPFPFKSTASAVTFSSGSDTLIFFPDNLFIIQGCKIGAVNYDDLSVSMSTSRFIENERVPKDAKIVDHTWQYVNKSGGPDKRFKNNRQFPVCLYGKFTIKSDSGLNTVILFSNADLR